MTYIGANLWRDMHPAIDQYTLTLERFAEISHRLSDDALTYSTLKGVPLADVMPISLHNRILNLGILAESVLDDIKAGRGGS